MITNSSIYAVIGLGVWLTFVIGRINIGQAAFVAIGGYTTAIFLTKLGFPFWVSFILSGLVSASVSLFLGLVLLKLKGVYFSMITLTFTSLMNLIFINAKRITNGASGIHNIPRPNAVYLGNLKIIPEFTQANNSYYYLVAVVLIMTIYMIWKLYNSRIGLVLKAIRQNEPLVQSIGIDIVKYRIIAYVCCSFLGGIGGSLFVIQIQNIFPQTFRVQDSVNYLLYCFMGGLDYIFGPVVGAFVLTISFELLRVIERWQESAYALIMIILMLWLPNGLLSINFSIFFKKYFSKRII